ncbi:AbiH family protein [Empedobacter brevis]
MNRIILIGNGFDLAHGLKTSYQNFIDSIIENLYYETKRRAGINTTLDIEIIVDPIDLYKDDYFNIDYFKRLLTSKPYKGIVYKNKFLEKLIYNRTVNNWCDIETLFYDELNMLLDDENSTNNDIEKFNTDFQSIIELLEKYLNEIKRNSKHKSEERLINLIHKTNLSEKDSSIEFKNNKRRINRNYTLNRTLILDFNYTQTIKDYIINSSTQKLMDNIDYINIHGVLNDDYNSIIFGFGDEKDEQYSKIEKSRLKDALKFIKSINYLKTSNYRNMLDFLELDDYQVYIWGHSCGVTDRTLLNHIFEHNNCTGIKPFYHEWIEDKTGATLNDYFNIVSNIARNFTDKNKLRDRVVDLSRCEQLIK